jgi:hypothetical protein
MSFGLRNVFNHTVRAANIGGMPVRDGKGARRITKVKTFVTFRG